MWVICVSLYTCSYDVHLSIKQNMRGQVMGKMLQMHMTAGVTRQNPFLYTHNLCTCLDMYEYATQFNAQPPTILCSGIEYTKGPATTLISSVFSLPLPLPLLSSFLLPCPSVLSFVTTQNTCGCITPFTLAVGITRVVLSNLCAFTASSSPLVSGV